MQANNNIVTFDDKEKNESGFLMLMNEKQEKEFNKTVREMAKQPKRRKG